MNLANCLSRRRDAVMGVATVMIVALHAHLTAFSLWNTVANTYGSLGVDFFVFVAGFGCVFSLRRDPDPGRFFHRRLERLLPVFYISCAAMIALAGWPGIVEVAQQIIPIGVWFGNGGTYWYVSATILYYLLVPPLYGAIRNARHPRLMALVQLIVFSTLVPIATRESPATVALMRLPALVLGVALGTFAQLHESRRDWALDALLLLGAFAFGVAMGRFHAISVWGPFDLMTHTQCVRLPRALYAPVLALPLACALDGIDRTPLRLVNRVLERVGRHSLEIYMSHVLVRYVVRTFFDLPRVWTLAAMLVFSYPLALALGWAAERLLMLYRRLPLFARDGDGGRVR